MRKYGVAILLLLFFSIASAAPGMDPELERAAESLNSNNRRDAAAAVAYLVKHDDEIPAALMFLGSARAMGLGDLENAGFLFYAAQIRAEYDIQRFPPEGKGGDSPAVALGALKHQIGAAINPRVFRRPQVFAHIVNRLAGWTATTKPGYHPGWDHLGAKTTAEGGEVRDKERFENIKANHLGFASGFSRLLNTPEYFEAFKTVQDYNFGNKAHRDAPEHKAARDEAEKTMQRIESTLKIKGIYYTGDNT